MNVHHPQIDTMQTVTKAMGPLMVHGDPQCLWSRKSSKRWSKYMKGVSAMYAYHIAPDKGVVTILSPPPTNNIAYVKSSSFINTYTICMFAHSTLRNTFHWSIGPIVAPSRVKSFRFAYKYTDLTHPRIYGPANSSLTFWICLKDKTFPKLPASRVENIFCGPDIPNPLLINFQ